MGLAKRYEYPLLITWQRRANCRTIGRKKKREEKERKEKKRKEG